MGLTEGSVVGNYQILGKLGEGGMGTVYKAMDTMLHRDIAIKALRPEISAQPDVLERFRSEAVLLAKLNHPAIAQLYSFFNDGGNFYMAMEFVAGETIERVIQKQGALEWRRAVKLTAQILDGLGEAHAANILHRDLKPANVMLTPAGKIKLMDFGIAQALGAARMTRQGRIIGTLEYLAPERIQGKPADVRSDLYSVGVMLFEMLSGKLPFQSESEYELLQMQIQQQPPQLGAMGVQVPPDVEAVMRKAQEKDPDRRYANTEEFSAALSGLLGGQISGVGPALITPAVAAAAAVSAPTVAVAAQPAAPSQFKAWMAKPVVWMASAGALLVAAGTITFSTLHSHQPPPTPAPPPDNGQPAIYHQQSSLKIDSTPIMVDQQPAQPAPTAQAPAPGTPTPAPKQSRATTKPSAQAQQQMPSPAPAPAPAPPTPSAPPAATPSAPPTTTATNLPPEPAPSAPANVPPPPTAAPPQQYMPGALPGRGIVRLSDAHSIFVAGGQGELDADIREEIQRQIGPRLRLAMSMADADIVMRVTLDEQRGSRLSNAGRMFGMKDRAEVRAVVVDAHTSHVIWQQGAGDKKPVIGAFKGDPMKRLAERIVKEFHESYGR